MEENCKRKNQKRKSKEGEKKSKPSKSRAKKQKMEMILEEGVNIGWARPIQALCSRYVLDMGRQRADLT